MIKQNTTIESLKEYLFDLVCLIEHHSRKEIMDMLSNKLQQMLRANNITFYIYNKWKLDYNISTYTNEYPPVCFIGDDGQRFLEHYNNLNEVANVTNDPTVSIVINHEQAFMLKIQYDDQFYGILFMTFHKDRYLDATLLHGVRDHLTTFLKMLYKNRHAKYERIRDEQLFALSSDLQSINRTTEMLEKVMEHIKKHFPHFHYYLLMTKDYDSDNLPIKMFDYTNERAGGAIAFMNNELQIERLDEQKTTNIFTPLSGEQSVYGVLQVEIPKNVTITHDEIDFIEKFSMMVGRAVERTTLYQISKQRVSDLEIITTASHRLNANIDKDQILTIAKRYIIDSCKPEEMAIISYHREDEAYTKLLQAEGNFFTTDVGKRFKRYLQAKVCHEMKPIFYGEFLEEEITIPYKSIIVIPLQEANGNYSIVVLLHAKPYYFSFDKFKFIQSFVQHVSLAYSNSILQEKLNELIITDHLTKLYSRNHLDETIVNHMEQDERGTFILMDIDDFKKVNDTHGHYVGDKVLIQVAEIIKRVINGQAIAARWGGEEFAVYVPHKSLEVAVDLADNIRAEIMNDTNPKVTMSFGVTSWNTKEDSIKQLFIRADEGLYEAKSSGKNKVVIK